MNFAKLRQMQEIIRKENYSFSDEQMSEIHDGLQKELDFLIYLNPEYTAKQMNLIKTGLEKGYDVSKYAKTSLSFDEMKEIFDSFENVPVKKEDSHEHKFKVEILKMPSCSETGIKKLICECGFEKEEEIPKTKHNFTTTKILPTCKTKGSTSYRCIICGYSYEDNFIPKTDHVYESTIIEEPTCKRPGEIKYTCVNCGYTYKKEIPIIDHEYESRVIKPSCIEEGYTLHTCKMCGKAYKDEIKEKIPHAYTNWEITKQPTCEEKGIKERTCLRCNHKDTKIIKPTGHNFITKRVDSTCTEIGQILGVCTKCNKTQVQDTIPVKPHKFGEWNIVKKPTIYEKGLRRRFCIDCNFMEEEEIDSKKLTMKAAQEDALDKIYAKKKNNKQKHRIDYNNLIFEPIIANYSKEDFYKYIEKKNFEFDPKEKLLIEQGLIQKLDVKIYANPKYDYETMEALKIGVEHGLDLTKYTKDYDAQQINEIRLGIEHDIEYKKYLNPNLEPTQMREIRLALEEGINVNKLLGITGALNGTPMGKFFQPKNSARDMHEKRIEIANNSKNNKND